MVKKHVFDEPGAKRVVAGIRKIENLPDGADGDGDGPDHGQHREGAQIRIGVAVGTVDAYSDGGQSQDGLLGIGTMQVKKVEKITGEWFNASFTMTVHNLGREIGDGERIEARRAGGVWVVRLPRSDEIWTAKGGDQAWVNNGTNITISDGTAIITNVDVWGLNGTTGILAAVDMWAEFYCEMDCRYQSGNCPTVRAGQFSLSKNGNAVSNTRARLYIENGINEGLGTSFTRLIACEAGDIFTVKVAALTRWGDDAGVFLEHVRFGARRLELAPP